MEHCSYRFAQLADLPILRLALSQEAWSCLNRLLESFCTNFEWILLRVENRAIAGVLALAAHSESSIPLEVFRLHGELDESFDSLRFLRLAIEKARMLGARELFCTLPENA